MKTKLIKYIALLLVLFGCNKSKEPDGDDADFCSCLNTVGMEKTIPIVNDYLAGLSGDFADGQKLQSLAAWLKSQPCIVDAEANPPKNEIMISFDENGINQKLVLECAKSPSLKATGYREYVDPKEAFCSCLTTENMDKTLPFIDEFLAGLPNDFGSGQNLIALTIWLKSHPCINDAKDLH